MTKEENHRHALAFAKAIYTSKHLFTMYEDVDMKAAFVGLRSSFYVL